MATKGRLAKESCSKLVSTNFVDVFLSESSTPDKPKPNLIQMWLVVVLTALITQWRHAGHLRCEEGKKIWGAQRTLQSAKKPQAIENWTEAKWKQIEKARQSEWQSIFHKKENLTNGREEICGRQTPSHTRLFHLTSISLTASPQLCTQSTSTAEISTNEVDTGKCRLLRQLRYF